MEISCFATHFWHYGVMSEQPGFTLHHSNQLPLLANALGHCLARTSSAGILQPDTVLIPQPSMRRWLQNSLAEQFGIAANSEFVPPGRFINTVLEPWLPKQTPLLSPELLQWRLFGLLQDTQLLKQAAFAPLSHFLSTGDAQHRAWQLAGELSQAVEKYQAWRKNWLLDWHKKAPEHDWQGILWHMASQGYSFRAQAYQHYFTALSSNHRVMPAALPSRLFVFACQNISPDALRILRSFGQWSEVHFFLHNPCLAYWGDVQQARSGQDLLDLRFDNALLNQCGWAGRDFVASLLSEQSTYDIGEQANYQAYGSGTLTLLNQIQQDVLHRQAAQLTFPDFTANNADDSLQIHACHTPLREVQVLRAQLLALFEKHPTLALRDVAIMAPNLELYAPYFASVFLQEDGAYPSLPFALSDQQAFADSPLAALFFQCLSLGQSRFSSNDGFALLSHAYVAAYYGLQKTDLERIHYWLELAAVRWGVDSAHRESIDGVAQQAFTWRYGLQRLLVGYASADDALMDGIAPVLAPIGQDQRVLDVLFEFVDFIEALHTTLNQAMSASQWQELLQTLLQKFTPLATLEDGEQEAYTELNSKIAGLTELAKQTEQDTLLNVSVLLDYLKNTGEQRLSQAWLSGRISICKMVPMRLIPFKVICLLGMNENAFPRQEPSAAINRLAGNHSERQIGDRNTREDDRFLFLQLLSACQAHLYISYIGQALNDGEALSPSILVKELLDTISDYFPNKAACQQHFIISHALHLYECALLTDPRIAYLQKPTQALSRAALPLFAPLYDCALPVLDETQQLSIEQLTAFWLKPIEHLAKRLGLGLVQHAVLLEEAEPYGKLSGLPAYQLEQDLLKNGQRAEPEPAHCFLARLQANGQLAPGALGRSSFNTHSQRIAQTLTELARLQIPAKPWLVELHLPRASIRAELIQNYSCGLIHIRANKKMNAKQHIRAGMIALLVCASELPLACFDFEENKLKQRSMLLSAQQARDALQQLADLMASGQQQMMCFEADASYAFYLAKRKNADLDVREWLDEALSKEADEFMPRFDDNLEFLTYGQGFIAGIAINHPVQFEALAIQVFSALMGELSYV